MGYFADCRAFSLGSCCVVTGNYYAFPLGVIFSVVGSGLYLKNWMIILYLLGLMEIRGELEVNYVLINVLNFRLNSLATLMPDDVDDVILYITY